MGGGAVLPAPLTYLEIAAWAALTGTRPTPWEVEALRSMDQAWMERQGNGKKARTPERQHQALGEYCKGEKVAECRRLFQGQLEKICATCPD